MKILITILILSLIICSVRAQSAHDDSSESSRRETVVLLHGLVRSSKAMNRIADELRGDGYRVINVDYPSTAASIEELAPQIFDELTPQIENDEIVHFVTHSMGGIVLRYYLQEHELANLGRVVMLAPPSKGSEVTDKLGNIFLYKWINGPAGNQLGTGKNSLPLRLETPAFELGIIAGDRSINLILSLLIPGPDDGKVSIARVRPDAYYQPMEIDLNIGRYVYPLADGGVDEERIAFWETDDQVHEQFSFNLTLKSAFPVADVRMPGYDQLARIAQSNDVCTAVLEQNEGGATLSRDIVFYYRLDDSVPARVEIIPYRESAQEPGTFMAVVTPAASLAPIQEGSDWIFLLDTSGSMSGGKIQSLAKGVEQVLGKMTPNDRFKLITFNDHAQELTRGYVQASPENVQQWITNIRQIQAGGGTALFAGLKKAYRSLDDDRTSGIILVTDGVCNVGPTEHKAFLELLREYDIRLFTFVMGNSANQPLMERLAKDSGGFAMNISGSDDIVGRLLQAKIKVMHQCMHDVQLQFSCEKVYDLTPASPGNLFMGQQLVAFGRYHGAGEVNLKLKAKISGTERVWNCTTMLP